MSGEEEDEEEESSGTIDRDGTGEGSKQTGVGATTKEEWTSVWMGVGWKRRPEGEEIRMGVGFLL